MRSLLSVAIIAMALICFLYTNPISAGTPNPIRSKQFLTSSKQVWDNHFKEIYIDYQVNGVPENPDMSWMAWCEQYDIEYSKDVDVYTRYINWLTNAYFVEVYNEDFDVYDHRIELNQYADWSWDEINHNCGLSPYTQIELN